MQIKYNEKAAEAAKDIGFDNPTPGVHEFIVSGASQGKNSGDVSIECSVTEGEERSRKCWINLNFSSDKPNAVAKAHEQWRDLCLACGVDPGCGDTNHVLNKKFMGNVEHSKPNDQGRVFANIRGMEMTEMTKMAKGSSGGGQSSDDQKSGEDVPDWMK